MVPNHAKHRIYMRIGNTHFENCSSYDKIKIIVNKLDVVFGIYKNLALKGFPYCLISMFKIFGFSRAIKNYSERPLYWEKLKNTSFKDLS